MAWYSRIFAGVEGRDLGLTASQQQLVAAWRELPAADMNRSHYRCRYVVVNAETAALSPKADRLVSIGAVALIDGLIDFKDSFQVFLAPEDADADAGGRNLQPAGVPPVEALISFLDFAGKAPLLAFHASFTARVIEGAMAEYLGIESRQQWIDLAWVMSDLFRDISDDTQGRLDAWLAHFAVESIQRHHALSDAYAIAQLLQITIARAARKGFATPASLLELEKARRHLHQSG